MTAPRPLRPLLLLLAALACGAADADGLSPGTAEWLSKGSDQERAARAEYEHALEAARRAYLDKVGKAILAVPVPAADPLPADPRESDKARAQRQTSLRVGIEEMHRRARLAMKLDPKDAKDAGSPENYEIQARQAFENILFQFRQIDEGIAAQRKVDEREAREKAAQAELDKKRAAKPAR